MQALIESVNQITHRLISYNRRGDIFRLMLNISLYDQLFNVWKLLIASNRFTLASLRSIILRGDNLAELIQHIVLIVEIHLPL